MSAFTPIPNQLLDWVLPRLTPAEGACLLYIARRTAGFVDPANPGRRKRFDRIALSQFIGGVHSGQDPLDLGTGLSRRATIKALRSLQQSGLVEVLYQCPDDPRTDRERSGCGWSGRQATVDARTGAGSCPRCKRTLSRLFALREMSSQELCDFLTARDRRGRRWYVCPRTGAFTTQPPQETQLPSQTLPAQLWFPELVEQLIEQAAQASRRGTVGEGRKVAGFYRPALALQENFDRAAVRHALEQTIRREVCRRADTRRWAAYARTCAQAYRERQHPERQLDAVDAVLERCAQLNRDERHQQAGAQLLQLLENAAALTAAAGQAQLPEAEVRRRVLAAYRRGLSDWLYAEQYTALERFAEPVPGPRYVQPSGSS